MKTVRLKLSSGLDGAPVVTPLQQLPEGIAVEVTDESNTAFAFLTPETPCDDPHPMDEPPTVSGAVQDALFPAWDELNTYLLDLCHVKLAVTTTATLEQFDVAREDMNRDATNGEAQNFETYLRAMGCFAVVGTIDLEQWKGGAL